MRTSLSAGRRIGDVLAGRRRYTLIEGDCLVLLASVPEGSVDLVLCDLPYGITNCPWDRTLPFPVLWWHYARVLKPAGAVVLTGSQPFTTRLAASNMDWFRYEWIWDKVNRVTGFQNAKRRPLKAHENVLVFHRKQPTYNPQMSTGKPYTIRRTGKGSAMWEGLRPDFKRSGTVNKGERYPTSILRIKAQGGENARERGLHPTQKPVALMEYLVRTYSNPGDVVLDNCAGSGTTGVACMRTARRFIGMEIEAKYLTTARRRLRRAARLPACPPDRP